MVSATRLVLTPNPLPAPSSPCPKSTTGSLRRSKSEGHRPDHPPTDPSSSVSLQQTHLAFPHDYHGIPLSCFKHPSKLSVLAPLEESFQFRSSLHGRRYKLLKTALNSALKELERVNRTDAISAPKHWKIVQEAVAEAFHTEFAARLQWGCDDPTDFIESQTPDSVFPSINIFLQEFPNVSIAWTVQDFYNRQERNFEELKCLQEMKHQWELGELHYIFWRTASGLRNSFLPTVKIPTPAWYTLLGGSKSRIPLLADSPPLTSKSASEEMEIWTPMHDRQRRLAQFQSLKQIRAYLHTLGIPFPIHFCPGGMTLVEYFSADGFPKIPQTAEEVRRVFDRKQSWKHWKDRELMMQVQSEGGELLDCDAPEEYFQSRSEHSTSRSSTPVETAQDSDVGLESSQPGDAPGDTRLQNTATSFQIPPSKPSPVKKDGWFSDWKSPRAGWPLALRA